MANTLRPKTNTEPTPGEKRFVTEVLLQGEESLWMQWVTKRKREKAQDRLLVVGKYRVFSIKRTVTGKKVVRRVGHFFDLKELHSSDVDKVTFKFKDFDIDVQGPGAGSELVHNLRLTWQKYTYSFPEYALPKITLLPPERTLQPLPQIDPGLCHGLIPTYEAYCTYYKVHPSGEFIKFVQDVAQSGNTELLLDECPGIERKENPINFVPIKCALRHNTYFTGFRFKGIIRRDIADYISDSLSHNITMKKVCINSSDAREEAFVNIGTALKKNQYNNVVDLEFSNNPVKEKGITGLSDGLQFLTHPILRLILANCSISSKGVAALFQGFCFGKEVARNLLELDLSFNNVGNTGTAQMCSWFNQTGINNTLQVLLLCSSRIETSALFRSMKTSSIRNLTELDVSGNKFDQHAGQALATVCDSIPALQVLNISYCELGFQAVENILRSIGTNPSLSDVTVNVSGNEIGEKGGNSIALALLAASNITYLIAKSCEFKKDGIFKIMDAISQSMDRSKLQGIDLSYNFNAGKSGKMGKLIGLMAEIVKKHPTLQYLGLAGDGNKKVIGKDLEILFKALAANPRLVELDITGNKIGDSLSVTLFDCLRSNATLKALHWDKNETSIGGWRALHTLLGANRSLVYSSEPTEDLELAVKESKTREQFREKAKELLDQIKNSVKQNAGGSTYTPLPKVKQGKTYSEKFKNLQHLNLNSSGLSDSQLANVPATPGVTQYTGIPENSSSSFYSPGHQVSRPDAPAPPPPPMLSVPTTYAPLSSEPAPPPPMDYSYNQPQYGYDSYNDTPNRNSSFYGSSYDYNYQQPPSYEYDDSQYEDPNANIPPPPPPPGLGIPPPPPPPY